MKNSFTVKTHNPKTEEVKPHFFVLSKGLNSGKPLEKPCPNCFIITAKNEVVKEHLYWLCFGLWQSKAFYIFLRGSVIPFISIVEFRKFLSESYSQAEQDEPKLKKSIQSLQLIEQKQKQYYETINLLEEAKRIVMHRYIKRH